MRPPYRKVGCIVRDARGLQMEPFPDVDEILKQLHENGIPLAAASRTTYPDGAFSLIKLYGWNDYFRYKEIYPGSKTTHFKKLAAASGASFNEMIFFDNESRNISDVSKMGVTCVLVDSFVGMTWKDLEKGFRSFAERHDRWSVTRPGLNKNRNLVIAAAAKNVVSVSKFQLTVK